MSHTQVIQASSVVAGEDSEMAVQAKLADMVAYLPAHSYIYTPTGELWPASSVNGRFPNLLTLDGLSVRPAAWLDKHRSVEQMVWDPREGPLIQGQIMLESGYTPHPGANVFNRYRPPVHCNGDPKNAHRWRELLQRLYGDEAAHIECYLAYKIQFPGVKINHALVLGGQQGIGKDTLLEPIKLGVGPWNWQEISPEQMLGRFNGWQRCVMLRISELRDLRDVRRTDFYDISKVVLAAPPDVLRVDEKNIKEH